MSGKTLVIVESPGKTSKISQYLGPDYIVKASFGHVQDLDKKTLSIEIENNFNPLYITSPDKTKVVKELKSLAKSCTDIILAADGDREGEAIAYSLANVLSLKNPKRIVFNEITKNAIIKAIENPGEINMPMVYAQQSRRILDRLIGYLLSPIIQKFGIGKSAGRVQSICVLILINKEVDIEKSISEPYFKTCAELSFGETKLVSTLQAGNKIFSFIDEDKATDFLNLINKKTEFKVISVDNKKSVRKPSAPFITSTLQQEASNKFHYSVKRTMDVAQKLYEGGHITYMRSDSPNMSQDAINDITKYIIKIFGLEYSDPKNYASKNESSQDAHECIRPTHLEKDNVSDDAKIDADGAKLYSLIWKRTIASQMSNANVNVQIIKIDAQNNKKTALDYDGEQTYFNSTMENIEFPGYLTVYDNTKEDDDTVIGKLEIKKNDKLIMNKIKVSEEYTKPPQRYNEAGLVKYLEKNGIGRPSTYASIITKVIERKYVVIKNVDGTEKESKQIELDSKYKIKETVKKVYIGKEAKKLVPTEAGKQVNEFMVANFPPIMNIQFTANFETFLDKIAMGKANWVTVLRNFYDTFSPIVDRLNSEAKVKKTLTGSSSDRLLGVNEEGKEIYTGAGKYGPYVKLVTSDKDFKYASLKDISIDSVTLDDAVKLFEFPKTLGKIGNAIVTLNKGQFGLYVKCSGKNYSIQDDKIDINDINLNYVKGIIETSSDDKYALKTFKVQGKTLNIKSGEFGNYIQIVNGTKKQNISIPKSYNIDTITIDHVLAIIATKNGTYKKK